MATKVFKNKSVERKVYYYKVSCNINNIETNISSIFDTYIKLLDSNYTNLEDRGLVVEHYDKFHFLDISQHEFDKNIYNGKFYSLRSTDFPYLFNMQNGNRQEITTNDQDTLMEQTHFCYIVNQSLIVSEFNFHGARIEQLSVYFAKIMKKFFPSQNLEITIDPIVMPDYFNRIANCKSISKMQFKIARPGLKMLKDYGIISNVDILDGQVDASTDYYIDVEVSGAGRGSHVEMNNLQRFLQNLINMVKKAKENETTAADGADPIFRKARLRGLDSDTGKIIPYDLLDEKLVQTKWVEKVSKRSKYVDTDKMFFALTEAYHEKRDTALKYMEKM